MSFLEESVVLGVVALHLALFDLSHYHNLMAYSALGNQQQFIPHLRFMHCYIQAAFFLEERDIMAWTTSQWLTSLHYAFQVSSHHTPSSIPLIK